MHSPEAKRAVGELDRWFCEAGIAQAGGEICRIDKHHRVGPMKYLHQQARAAISPAAPANHALGPRSAGPGALNQLRDQVPRLGTVV